LIELILILCFVFNIEIMMRSHQFGGYAQKEAS